MLEELKDEVKRNNIQNVSFVGRVARELIPSYMNLSDVLVANYLPNKYMDICIPGKLFEYAISNKPIVMGSNGEAKKLIEEYSLGLVAVPSNIYDFEKAFKKIFDSSFKFNPNLNRFVEDFSLKKVSDSYSVIFNQIINKMNKILITGGSGFIGTNMVEYYINQSFSSILNLDITSIR